jgi:hypothetical protein
MVAQRATILQQAGVFSLVIISLDIIVSLLLVVFFESASVVVY